MASTISAGITTTTALVYSADTSGVLQLQTNGGTTALTLDTSQNAGFGVTPSGWTGGPATQFKYGGSVWNNSDSSFHISENAYFNGSWNYISGTSASATNYFQSTGTHNWRYASAGTGALTWTTGMILDVSGNLGLGVTPSAWGSGYKAVQIQSGAVYQHSSTDFRVIQNAYYATGNSPTYINTQAASMYRQDTGTHYWYNAPSGTAGNAITFTNAMTLDASGSLLVGTTSATSHSFWKSISNDWVVNIRNTQATAPYGLDIYFSGSAPNNTTSPFIYCEDQGGTQRASIRSNGGLYNYSANNSNLSDQREKKDIELASNYLDKICAIPVKTFLYNDQTDTDKNLGVIAQDVQAVAPELVTESNWANKDEEPKIRLSIYQTDLQYALMKCIQELSAQVTTLQTQVTALKG